ncbi:MAG: CBS domain-containing protein [Bdellovibrionales bacterium]|nr:CBS domain-containing protein [Bdellovibrionales bacterium]
MSTPVRTVMTSMPHTIGHDMTIETAKEMMREYSCHHLPVLDGGKLVGVISDRDLRLLDSIKGSQNTPIEDIMTDEPVLVSGNTDVFQVAMLMHEKKIGSVIVQGEADLPWGIFTATDALKIITKNKS